MLFRNVHWSPDDSFLNRMGSSNPFSQGAHELRNKLFRRLNVRTNPDIILAKTEFQITDGKCFLVSVP